MDKARPSTVSKTRLDVARDRSERRRAAVAAIPARARPSLPTVRCASTRAGAEAMATKACAGLCAVEAWHRADGGWAPVVRLEVGQLYLRERIEERDVLTVTFDDPPYEALRIRFKDLFR